MTNLLISIKMKTRKIISGIVFLVLLLLIAIGCKKSSSTSSTDTTSLQQITTDANSVRGASDEGMFDVDHCPVISPSIPLL